MILRVQNFLMIALFALFSLFWAQSFVSQNPISGGYQFFEEAASGDFTHNPLNALEKFAPSPKTASDYANAPNGRPGLPATQWDNWRPPAGYTRNADGTVTHTSTGQVYTPVRDSSGNVRTNSNGDPIFETENGTKAYTLLTKDATSGETIYVATNGGAGGERLLWGSWDDYPKVTRTGPNGPQEYAVIGDRLYSQHAVARMQPSGQRYSSGAPVEGQPNLVGRETTPPYVNQPGIQNFDGTQNVRGRSISPNYVEDIIGNTKPTVNPTNGNRSYSSGDVSVITSSEGRVITIITGTD